VMADGLSVYRAKYVQFKPPSIMSIVKCQKYFIKTANNPDFGSITKAINDIITEERLLVKHKEKEKWVETKKAILDIKAADGRSVDSKDYVEFGVLLSVGDNDVIRPDILMRMVFDRLSCEDKPEIIEICRTNQFVNRDIPLEDIYEFYESVELGSECN
jgi:hypothetical protein